MKWSPNHSTRANYNYYYPRDGPETGPPQSVA